MKQYFYLQALVLLLLVGCSTSKTQNKSQNELLSLFPIESYYRNVDDVIKPSDPGYDTPLLTQEVQQKYFTRFYDCYYGRRSPWSADFINKGFTGSISNYVNTTVEGLLASFNNKDREYSKIGYGTNFRPHTGKWINNIYANINIAQFNNLVYKPENRAIAIDNLYGRVLPTEDASFYHYTIAGEGYPFDNLQMTAVWAGTPLYIVGTTKDSAWLLVLTPEVLAWVRSNGVARANNKFVDQWQKAAKANLVAITTTKTSILDMKGNFLFSAYIGSVFPMVDTGDNSARKLMVPAANNGYAYLKYSIVSTENTAIMPMLVTPHNMASVIKGLIGRSYGWGNLNFYNDCSSEMKNLYTPFGIFLPRNTKILAKFGKVVDLKHATAEERIAYVIANGKPFLTIMCVDGHAILYIGNAPDPRNKNSLIAMTYQNKWGLKSAKEENTRIIIGESAFLPLVMSYPEAPHAKSLAEDKHFKVIFLGQ